MKILRTMGILALVAGLLLGGAGGTFAQEEEPELAEIEGVISDTEAGTVTIAPEQGEAVILTITEDTEINKDEEPATIEDLAKDDEVEARYNPETLEAVEIAAQSPEPAETPEPAENGGPAGGPPDDRGPHSLKHGLFGTVASVETITEGYVIELETKEQGTFDITANVTAKYMVPRETHGPKGLATFLGIVDENENDDLEELVGRRVAVLVTLTSESTADTIRLMLIPSPAHHRYMHRVGVVDDFDPGSDIITIIDKDGEPHTFTLNGAVYRPDTIAGLTGTDLEDALAGGCVTVVTKGDPKLGPIAKTIVLHDELPDWASVSD